MTPAAEKYRLLLDARGLAGRRSGVGKYVSGLVSGIAALQPDDFALRLLCLPEDNPPAGIEAQILGGFYSGARPNTVRQHLVMPLKLNKVPRDVYHYPCFDLPIVRLSQAVVTCHDIEPLVTPHLFARKIVLYYKFFSKRLRSLKNIITISGKTATDLVEIIGIERRRIQVIYFGVDECFRPVVDDRQLRDLRRRFVLPDDYILYVGNTMPHKNLERLILAFSRISSDFPDVCLVIAGAADRYRNQVRQFVTDSHLENQVIFLDSISEEDLPLLYSDCRLFAFPSLYEGFGLPVLEAMACGAPVLASDAASLPEIVGEAGLLVSPLDTKGMANGLSRILADKSLADNLSQAGIQRAADFTWEKCARSHLSFYRRLLGKAA